MDNLTHSFCGWILSRAGLDRYGPWVPLTLIVCANLPDIESIFPPYGDQMHYLVNHRGLSHSVIGLAGEILIVTLLLVAIGRLFKNRISEPPRLGSALLVASIGVSSHLLLDWFNTYGVRPWLPFDGTWYYGDLSFIIDPWQWLIPGLAIFLGSPLRRREMMFWSFLLALCSGVVYWGASRRLIPWGVIAVWVVVISAVILWRVLSRREIPTRTFGRFGLIAWILYVFVLFVCSRTSTIQALKVYGNEGRAEKIVKSSANPVPGIPWRYEVLLQSDNAIRQYSVNLLFGTVAASQSWNVNQCREYLPMVENTPEYSAWRVFARHPICSHQNGALLLGDARYRTTNRGDWTQQRVELPQRTMPPDEK